MSGIAVVGLGNVLAGDDAFGPTAVQHILAGWALPPGVRVRDLGTPGSDLMPELEGLDALIVVDTVREHAPPGALRTYSHAEILAGPALPRTQPHQPTLKETLQRLELAGTAPRSVLLVGVVPERITPEPGLSPAVRAALPRALDAVRCELERLGSTVQVRTAAAPLVLWWERPPQAAPTVPATAGVR